MLSRLGENLFWIGRYVERAEDTARLLDVTYHGVLEAGSDRTPDEMWAELLDTLNLSDELPDFEGPHGEEIGELLIADRQYPGSLVSIISRARENARTSREWLSVEVWESLNDLHLYLARGDLAEAGRDRPYEVLRVVKSSCQAINGAVDASMPRGEGHQFYLLGQRIERALLSTRVLHVWHDRLGGFVKQAAFAEWVKLLKSLSAYEAYLRSFEASMDGRRVLAFLLQSKDFPRSVLHCLMRIGDLLQSLDPADSGAELRRRAGRVRSDVEFADLAGPDPDLGPLLELAEQGIVDLAVELEHAYFRPTNPVYMHSYEAF